MDSFFHSDIFDSYSGSDNNLGLSSQPWATIAKANSTLVAGDIVYIKAGTYTNGIAPVNSGTANSPITYSIAPGETPWSVIVTASTGASISSNKIPQ